MPKLNTQLLLSTLTITAVLLSGAASADTNTRTSSSRLETIEAPRSTINRKQTSVRSSTSRNTTTSTPSSNINRRTTTIQKPATSYKPSTSTYQKPQRSYKPITTSKPTVNKYRPPVNNSQPAVNNYRPPINAYKPPVNNSRPSTRPSSSTFRPVFPKPSVSTGLRRTDERNQEHDDSAAHNNRNTIRPYRPWSSVFNNRYDPSRHQNWYSNAGHRFPIEHSYNVWSNSYNQTYRPGYSTSYLPSYYDRFNWNNTPYYSYGGLYFSYNRGNSHFSLVSAPIGYRMNRLPQHSIGFYHGDDLYFNAYDNYYRWLPTSREYIIVDRPLYDEYDDESYAAAEETYHVSYNDGDPIYYPAAGQNEAQMSLDLDECHIWSAKETNFDPAIPYPSYDEYKAEGFGLALEACMTSRGYTVL